MCVCVETRGKRGGGGGGGGSQLDSYINIGEITRDKLKEIQSEISLVWRQTRTHIPKVRSRGKNTKSEQVMIRIF